MRPASEVLKAFLKLGLTSFGGPIAHLGYFHREFVVRRQWVDEQQYAQLLALSQFLPGPASSQLGFALGLIRAGWPGALAAFIAFTLPSAVLLIAFAGITEHLTGPYGERIINGLKLVAVAVVADGVRRMSGQLAPDAARRFIAACSAIAVVIFSSAAIQLCVIALSAMLGHWLCRNVTPMQTPGFPVRISRRTGVLLLSTFAVLLALSFAATYCIDARLVQVSSGLYQAGALVFGGGHVVLPLLQERLVDPGWINVDDFLTGYGAAQAVPGPLFSVAAYFGAQAGSVQPAIGAFICTMAIFLPGFLLIGGALPFWNAIAQSPAAIRAMAGLNAAVLGLLIAALYRPLWVTAIHTPIDFGIALVGFALMAATRLSPLAVVAWCVAASLAAPVVLRAIVG